MMRKLATTVIALSLVALGCGSDDSTPPKTDTAVPQTDGAAPDTKLGPDSPATTPDGPEGSDTAMGPDAPVVTPDAVPGAEAGKMDVTPGAVEAGPAGEAGQNEDVRRDSGTFRDTLGPDLITVPVDAQPADTMQPELDAGTPDAPAAETEAPMDGGDEIDGGTAG